MSNSLRCRIKKWCYQGIINEKDRDRLINGLDCADALKWIPVSERLPEAGVSVIVTSKGGYVYTSNIAHGEWEYGGDVIAWMPLPQPYEPQESEVEE